ncbi:AraC family transcriptional regulator [uncultured Roseibium sp.]|uniref:AraC family transcriptional regulator n=1 Tax=uncultured Roseibium sp. TaxID=1936171 RepID=UPI0026080DBB|nr:AraC family transcriptional regulator [uncultured Roseibium sp.]
MQTDQLTQNLVDFADERGADGEPFDIGIPGVTLVRQRHKTHVYPVVFHPIFCLVLQGAKQTYVGGRTVSFASGQSLIVGLDLPAESRVIEASSQKPYVALALDLDMVLLRELSGEINLLEQGNEKTVAVTSGKADGAIVDAMRRLFELTEMPEATAVLEPLIKREVHFWLLKAAHCAILRQLVRRDSRAARISTAIARIKREFATALRVEDLAQDAAMSVSAFHAAFKDITGTTPLQFQKMLRLMEARRLLQNEKLPVSNTAFQVGYESPTQFSREYSRQFGQTPRADKVGSSGVSVR